MNAAALTTMRVTGIVGGLATLGGIYKLNQAAAHHDQVKLTSPMAVDTIPWTAIGAGAVPLTIAAGATLATVSGKITPQAAMGVLTLVSAAHFAGLATGIKAD